MIEEPTHAQIYAALDEIRGEIRPLVDMAPDLKEMVELLRALRVGGKGLKWMASIASAILMLGGIFIAVKNLWHGGTQ